MSFPASREACESQCFWQTVTDNVISPLVQGISPVPFDAVCFVDWENAVKKKTSENATPCALFKEGRDFSGVDPRNPGSQCPSCPSVLLRPSLQIKIGSRAEHSLVSYASQFWWHFPARIRTSSRAGCSLPMNERSRYGRSIVKLRMP